MKNELTKLIASYINAAEMNYAISNNKDTTRDVQREASARAIVLYQVVKDLQDIFGN